MVDVKANRPHTIRGCMTIYMYVYRLLRSCIDGWTTILLYTPCYFIRKYCARWYFGGWLNVFCEISGQIVLNGLRVTPPTVFCYNNVYILFYVCGVVIILYIYYLWTFCKFILDFFCLTKKERFFKYSSGLNILRCSNFK